MLGEFFRDAAVLVTVFFPLILPLRTEEMSVFRFSFSFAVSLCCCC